MVAPIDFTSPSQLKNKAAPLKWIWPGVVAHGAVTLLTSEWKSGKSTLLSVLLSKLGNGGTLAGSAIPKCKAYVFSEESEAVWDERHARLKFVEGAIDFSCQPYQVASEERWFDRLRGLMELPPGLVVIDSLTEFLPPGVENYAAGLRRVTSPMHVLTRRGHALMMTHHPAKYGRGRIVERGSGDLTAFVDIRATLDAPAGALSDRVRSLALKSRPFGFNRTMSLELSADGTDYRVVPAEPDFKGFDWGWGIVKAMIQDSKSPPTRKELLINWLEDFEKPSFTTLRRWLERAEAEGLVEVSGTGRHNDTFKYRLVGAPVPEAKLEEIGFAEIAAPAVE